MTGLSIDIFTDETKAKTFAQVFRDAAIASGGSCDVNIETVTTIIVRDNEADPPVIKCYKNSSTPLYVLICK